MGWLGHPYEATRSTLQGRGCSLSVAGGGWVRSYASQLCATRLWASGRRHDRKSKQQDHIFLQSLSKLVDRACSARVMTCVAHMKLPDGAHHGDGGREAFRTFDPSPHGDEVPWPLAHASERFPRLVWAPRTRRGPSKKTPWCWLCPTALCADTCGGTGAPAARRCDGWNHPRSWRRAAVPGLVPGSTPLALMTRCTEPPTPTTIMN